jgi:aspartyl protease family protein
MARNYLIVVFFMGLFAAMMSNCSSRGSGPFRSVSPSAAATGTTRSFGSVSASDGSSSSGSGSSYNDGSSVELQRNGDGHFYADVQVNGSTLHMLVDTGATGIALSRDDARAAGLATSIGMNDVVGEGADGAVHGEYVKLDNVSLGGTSASGLEAVVLNGGSQSLLGQEFLAKFDSVEIHGDTMVLK